MCNKGVLIWAVLVKRANSCADAIVTRGQIYTEDISCILPTTNSPGQFFYHPVRLFTLSANQPDIFNRRLDSLLTIFFFFFFQKFPNWESYSTCLCIANVVTDKNCLHSYMEMINNGIA